MARAAHGFLCRPWRARVAGRASAPKLVDAMTDLLDHAPSPQPDGHADVDDVAQRRLDDIAHALKRALALAHGVTDPPVDHMLPSSWQRFQLVAGVALALCDSGTLARAKAETMQDLAGELDLDLLGEEVDLIRRAIVTFEGKLFMTRR